MDYSKLSKEDTMRKSEDARQLANERRTSERERDMIRHAARSAKYSMRGAW